MNSQNKVDAWCNAALEAGWLAALVVAPMFFNVFSSRVFEPDKISLVRSIALFMLLCWLVKVANSGQLWLPAYVPSGTVHSPLDETGPPSSLLQRMWRIPFLVPVLLLVIAYAIGTLFSVARFVSWWGSYQRLQGTYTYLSYIIIAVLAAAHLRTPDQIRRLQHAFIVVSLPIAIYGVIQHGARDPLPWGGDVTTRVAANAGNAIFLAAYLIMALFFTVERIYSSFAHLVGAYREPDENGSKDDSNVQDMPAALAGGAYLFIFMVQLLAIFWTQSRGPTLAILLGFYLFGLLLFTSLRPRGYRWLTLSWVGLGMAGFAFLVLLNTSASVASIVKSVPSLVRLSTILDLESNTAQVRILIWDGASRMIAPHEPIIYPDGSDDAINSLRPLVGYGPEAMWVAYNPFYPPDLAHHERRNASPDRSHNETWDSLVITGILGFIAYMSLFISIFYWALRWLGLIDNRRDTILFSVLLLGFSLLFTFFARQLDGGNWRLLGVAIPGGLMLGLGIYVTLAVFLHPNLKPDRAQIPRQLLIIALVCTLAAHFVEIHFGIAIAATRTYFWIQTALLLVLGMQWAHPSSFAAVAGDRTDEEALVEEAGPVPARRRGRAGRKNRQSGRRLLHGAPALPAYVMIDLLIFLTFVFIYSTNSQGLDSPFTILWNSITKRTISGVPMTSLALFFLMLFTWLVSATLGLAQTSLSREQAPDAGWWLRGYGLHALVVWGGWLIYGLIQGGRLIPLRGVDLTGQLENVAGHFAIYTWLLVLWIVGAGIVFGWSWLRERIPFGGGRLLISGVTAIVLTPIIFWFISTVNIGLVRADIIYKQGQQFDGQGNWISSIELYRRALQARTTEDHYMLFLGRALLEQAKQSTDEGAFTLGANPTLGDVLDLTPEQISQMKQTELLRAAETVLKEAQRVNPLNTDHTANLARLYRTWADLTPGDADIRQTKLDESLAAYEMAVTLSPNAAHLWNERGNAFLAAGLPERTEEAYKKSLELDKLFPQTYLLLADLYERNQEYDKMIEMLNKGIADMDADSRIRPTGQMYNYLAVALSRTGETQGAIDASLKVLDMQPGDVNAMRNLMLLYRDASQPEKAIEVGQSAIELTAPDNVQLLLQLRQLLADLYTDTEQPDQVILQYEQMRQLNPNDVNLSRALTALYQSQGETAKLIETLQILVALDPGNYEYPLQLARVLPPDQKAQALAYAQRALELAPEEQKSTVNQLLEQLQ